MNVVDKLRAFISRRGSAYRAIFSGPNADLVLVDLASFCRAHQSTFHEDPRLSAMLDGRREVYLRIINHIKLTEAELFTLSTGKPPSSEVPMIDPEKYHG